MDQTLSGIGLEKLKTLAREWWDWNRTCSCKPGGLDLAERFGVEYDIADQEDARRFMNAVYDKLVVAVRAQAGKDWKP